MTDSAAKSTPATPAARTAGTVAPRLDAVTLRKLTWAVPLTLVIAAVALAAMIVITGRHDWWPSLMASTVVSLIAAVAAVLVLLTGSHKTADYAVTLAMGLTLVRAGVTIVGIAAAIKLFDLSKEPTVFMACGFYGATLIVESVLLARAVSAAHHAQPTNQSRIS